MESVREPGGEQGRPAVREGSVEKPPDCDGGRLASAQNVKTGFKSLCSMPLRLNLRAPVPVVS